MYDIWVQDNSVSVFYFVEENMGDLSKARESLATTTSDLVCAEKDNDYMRGRVEDLQAETQQCALTSCFSCWSPLMQLFDAPLVSFYTLDWSHGC
mgnify:CR=1 FL=1